MLASGRDGSTLAPDLDPLSPLWTLTNPSLRRSTGPRDPDVVMAVLDAGPFCGFRLDGIVCE